MANIVSTNNQESPFDVLPEVYTTSVRNRIKVTKLSTDEIKKEMKTADVYSQVRILFDLLQAGDKGMTETQRSFLALAAELFLKSSEGAQKEFLTQLFDVKALRANFTSAIASNTAYHEFTENQNKGSSGLSMSELALEKHIANYLIQYKG